MQESQDRPLVERSLKRCDSGDCVMLRIFQPRKNSEPEASGEWRCDFEITGLGEPLHSRALGEDAMQALLLVFPSIKAKLRATGIPVTWFEGGAPWDIGIPSYIPCGDQGFEELIERIIEVEYLRRCLPGRPP